MATYLHHVRLPTYRATVAMYSSRCQVETCSEGIGLDISWHHEALGAVYNYLNNVTKFQLPYPSLPLDTVSW